MTEESVRGGVDGFMVLDCNAGSHPVFSSLHHLDPDKGFVFGLSIASRSENLPGDRIHLWRDGSP